MTKKEMTKKRFPTGIEFFDKQTGGLYPGLVILLEEVGAGGREFALSMIFRGAEKYFKASYIALSSSVEEVINDSKLSFPEAPESRLKELEEKVKIISLAEHYFESSIVPYWWISSEKPTLKSLRKKDSNILEELVNVCDAIEDESLVFVDSMSDLVRLTREKISWNDLIDFVKGMRKLCVKRNILTLTTLTRGMLEKGKEEELMDQADGAILFEWEIHKEGITRWMYIRKLLGVLPVLEKKKISKYSIRIDPSEGFTISQLVRIM